MNLSQNVSDVIVTLIQETVNETALQKVFLQKEALLIIYSRSVNISEALAMTYKDRIFLRCY